MARDLADDPERELRVAISDSFDRRYLKAEQRPPCRGSIVGIRKGELWSINLAFGVPNEQRVLDKVVAGESANSAILFSELYYDRGRPMERSELVAIAALVICFGSKFKGSGIYGLEIAIWDKATERIELIDADTIIRLKKQADSLDDTIRKGIGGMSTTTLPRRTTGA